MPKTKNLLFCIVSAVTLRQIAAASVTANIASHIWRSFTCRREHYWSLGHWRLFDCYRPAIRSVYALSEPPSMKISRPPRRSLNHNALDGAVASHNSASPSDASMLAFVTGAPPQRSPRVRRHAENPRPPSPYPASPAAERTVRILSSLSPAFTRHQAGRPATPH